MRLVRRIEDEIIRLKGDILDLRRERDNQKKRADRFQRLYEQIKTIAPNAASQEKEFNQLREKFKGYSFSKGGKVRLREQA